MFKVMSKLKFCLKLTLLVCLISVYVFFLTKCRLPYETYLNAKAKPVTKYISRIIRPHLYPKNYVTTPPTTSLSYEEAQYKVEAERMALAKAYKAAKPSQKDEVLDQARRSFIESTTTLLPYWYGTPWDFNGTSNTPQKGMIACGYYVTTILEDSGLKIERNRMAQQASENIIKSLTSEAYIERFSNVALDDFIARIDNWGEGLYIVGLDFHVGYIWHDGQDIHFIHSTVVGPRSAFSEPAKSSPTLGNSKYRVLGKISEDDELLVKWLMQTNIDTKI